MEHILITGHKGFVGSHLKSKLEKNGYSVTGADLPEYNLVAENAFHRLKVTQFKKVFHLAALTFIPDSWKNPEMFFNVNLTGTLHVLEFCRETGSPLTYISCYLYGHPAYLPIDEKHPIKALNPYHQSKLLAEQLCLFYREHFKVPVVIIRPFNIYGPGQRPDFLIPSIITQLENDQTNKVTINDPTPRRDYLFIDDFTNVLDLTLKLEKGLFNVGSGSSASVTEIADLLISISGKDKRIDVTNRKRIDEIDDLYADCTLIREVTGWTPSVTLMEGLSRCFKKE